MIQMCKGTHKTLVELLSGTVDSGNGRITETDAQHYNLARKTNYCTQHSTPLRKLHNGRDEKYMSIWHNYSKSCLVHRCSYSKMVELRSFAKGKAV